MSQRGRLVVVVGIIVVLSVALVTLARATMIVVIYTDDGYWLAGDGYRSSGGKHVADVCKIHETRFGLLAKSGETQGVREPVEIYSTDREILDLLNSVEDIESFESKLRVAFKRDIEQEEAFVLDDPTVTGQNLEENKFRRPLPDWVAINLSRTVTMFNTKVSDDKGKILLVQPQSDRLIDPILGAYFKYWARSISGWHSADTAVLTVNSPHPISYPSSVHELAYPVSYSKTDAWVQKHPKQALIELLQQGHRGKPEEIGPPYAIVHVIWRKSGPPKIDWVSKGKCPGWTETIDRENSLVRLREKQRKALPIAPP
jgi:hypothetical protein